MTRSTRLRSTASSLATGRRIRRSVPISWPSKTARGPGKPPPTRGFPSSSSALPARWLPPNPRRRKPRAFLPASLGHSGRPAGRFRGGWEILEDRAVPAIFVAPTFATGADPAAEVKGDFAGNGHLDIAVANEQSNTVSVLLGN